MTAFTLKISDFLIENPYLVAAFMIIPPVALVLFFTYR
ncbi:MAG: hypothetical protein KatS3mg037_2616 [Ignavibacterium sp.]|nr:MAG: hypothetical protein KatS3mg037_2616 [Ignavibacterium sp.]